MININPDPEIDDARFVISQRKSEFYVDHLEDLLPEDSFLKQFYKKTYDKEAVDLKAANLIKVPNEFSFDMNLMTLLS